MQIVMPPLPPANGTATGAADDVPPTAPTAPLPAVPKAPAAGAAPTGEAPNAPWTNPAATAALRSTVQILKSIEDGIVQNYAEAEKVRGFASDLRAASDIFQTANEAITNDASKDNDAFLPLIGQAGTRVTGAEMKLSSKSLASTWPSERSTILDAIRQARVISANVADQLDPTHHKTEL